MLGVSECRRMQTETLAVRHTYKSLKTTAVKANFDKGDMLKDDVAMRLNGEDGKCEALMARDEILLQSHG
jgi:hypothetical protein